MSETPEKVNAVDVMALFHKDPEEITDDERKALIQHYRELREKFAALDAKGKVRQMRSKKPLKSEPTDEELLNAKILGD